MYINRYPVPQNQIAANDSEEVQKDSETKRDDNTEDNKKLILDAFKSINDTLMENIKELNRLISKLAERVENLENQIFALESQIESEKSGRNQIPQSEISNITTELELLKRNSSVIQPEENKEPSNKPIMPGCGFSAITPEYLRSLYKR